LINEESFPFGDVPMRQLLFCKLRASVALTHTHLQTGSLSLLCIKFETLLTLLTAGAPPLKARPL